MKRIKVLHVITHLGVGGALDNTLLTVERLPRDRYEVDLAAGPLPSEDGYTSWEQRSRECADGLFLFPDLQRPVRPLRDLRACLRLTDFIRKQGYQIVHTHCSKAGVVGRLAARRAGVPVIVHTCHAFGSQVTRDSQGKLLRRMAGSVKQRVFVSAERQAARISDRIITVCEQNRQQAIQQRLAPPEKIVTIHSGIDLKQFDVQTDRQETCRSLGLDPARPIVGFIGRLAVQKAPLDFVSAAKSLLQSRPDAQVLIAGDGPLLEEVRSAIADQPQIRLLGFHEQIPELMSALDVLGVSSLWEGLGRSVTEAMIMGVPVAATAVDGVPELVIHGRTGLLSPPRDPAALAKNMLQLLDRPEEARAMARCARSRALPRFGADRMLEEIDHLYQDVLRHKKATMVAANNRAIAAPVSCAAKP